MKTPVAFMVFNRPDTTARVFEAIRQAKPTKLLVIADGPRTDRLGEAEKCQQVRDICDRVDWECEVLKNYSDLNLGCKKRVSSGLDWVFREVEEAIVLEDDCLPDQSFFPFCQELLEKYRHDQRITFIGGSIFQLGRKRSEYSYYFSRYNHVWGWASWRRAWQYYDAEMTMWEEIRNGEWLKFILQEPKAIKSWTKIFQDTYDHKIDTWDFQVNFAFWIQNGLSVIPNVNLISNIGFGKDATHTTINNNPLANLAAQKIDFPLNHPHFIVRHTQADEFTQNHAMSQSSLFRLLVLGLLGIIVFSLAISVKLIP